jgi:pimeloyl-ACP methyl ester carboxylesterase
VAAQPATQSAAVQSSPTAAPIAPDAPEAVLFAEEATADQLGLIETGRHTDGPVIVRDVRFAGAEGTQIAAYIVEPGAAPYAGGVLFLHWLGNEDSTRREFLDEAVALAGEGFVSILPQQTFPWGGSATGIDHDRVAIGYQVRDLRRAMSVLAAETGSDRLAVVGHDFGGMYATILAAVDERARAYVFMAPTAAWADWFIPYGDVLNTNTEAQYRSGMRDLDPVTVIRSAASARLLFQFAASDRFVPKDKADELFTAAPQPKESRTYPGVHRLTDAARVERDTWLTNAISLPRP